MVKINICGDFKVNQVKHLNMSGELMYLLNTGDINMVNFEAPICSIGKPIKKSGPNISQNVESPSWLEQRGFNAISLANNHTMDFGHVGLQATRDSFKKATLMGAGTWNEAYKIHQYISQDGFKIGILCCTHCEFGTLTEDCGVGCAWAMSPEIIRLIKKGHDEVDFLIVMPHGGIEYMDQPLPEWREMYKLWIDLGADAVVGSHPHVPQGWEIYKGKPICYSLGNFCFNSLNKKKRTPAHWFESLCCSLTIEKPHQCVMDIIPLFFDQNTEYISINDNADFLKHIETINTTLTNEKMYMNAVNLYVKELLPFYYNQFTRGGLGMSLFSIGFLKGLVEGFMGKGFFGKRHAINNIRCESHRWAILRAMNLK